MGLLAIGVETVAADVPCHAAGATAVRNEHLHVPASPSSIRDAGTLLFAYIDHDEHHRPRATIAVRGIIFFWLKRFMKDGAP